MMPNLIRPTEVQATILCCSATDRQWEAVDDACFGDKMSLAHSAQDERAPCMTMQPLQRALGDRSAVCVVG
jgi:hypothetical protein